MKTHHAYYGCEYCADPKSVAGWEITEDDGGKFLACDKCKQEMVRRLRPEEKVPPAEAEGKA